MVNEPRPSAWITRTLCLCLLWEVAGCGATTSEEPWRCFAGLAVTNAQGECNLHYYCTESEPGCYQANDAGVMIADEAKKHCELQCFVDCSGGSCACKVNGLSGPSFDSSLLCSVGQGFHRDAKKTVNSRCKCEVGDLRDGVWVWP